MSAENDRRVVLIDCLLTTREHQRLFQTSATFRYRVEALVDMLPQFVAGFGVEAERVDQVRAQALADAMAATPAVWLLPDGTVQPYLGEATP